jgi:hypothetical protein
MTQRLCFFLAFLPALLYADQQEPNMIPGHLMAHPPVIDGVVTPEEWSGVPSFEGLLDSRTGQMSSEGGRFWLAYDGQFIYFAAKLIDSQPHLVSANEYRTNVSLRGDDTVGLALDPFGSLSDFNYFEINPRGATNVRIAGGRAAKREWLGDIQAKGRITEEGWEVEARIPWSIMRLPSTGVHELRFNVFRNNRRLQREFNWAFIRSGQISNYGRWRAVEIPPAGRRRFQLLPYGYIGGGDGDGMLFNSGVDFRTTVTDQVDVVGAVNPDFRNVENQVLSLDFSYFERLAGETRPFFLEGANFFRTAREASLFASQRIQRFDVGLKAFGKLDARTDIGILDAVEHGVQNSVATRIRRQLTPRSSVEAAYVGLDRQGLKNDGSFLAYSQNWGELSGYAQHMATWDDERGNGHRYNAGLSFNRTGFNAGMEFVEVSPDFLPRLGFAPERNFRGLSGRVGYVHPVRRGSLIEAGGNLFMSDTRTFGGDIYRRSLGFNTTATFLDGTNVELGGTFRNFRGFNDRTMTASIERPRGDPYRRWQLDYSFGTLSDRDYANLRGSFAYRPVQRFQVIGSLQSVRLGTDRNEQVVLSANYDLAAYQAVSGRAVYRQGKWNAYASFRQSGGYGTDYFLIVGDPNSLSFRPSVILKVAVPLDLRF